MIIINHNSINNSYYKDSVYDVIIMAHYMVSFLIKKSMEIPPVFRHTHGNPIVTSEKPRETMEFHEH